jgi:hypothetical protein
MPRKTRYAHVKDEALRRYAAGAFYTDIKRDLGVPFSTMCRWAKVVGIDRRLSESKAMAAARTPGGARHLGRKSAYVSPKAGVIVAESSYERARLTQLEADPNVLSITRCNDVIGYEDGGKPRNYNPDFDVILVNGDRRVEEVKPALFLRHAKTALKVHAGRRHYAALGIEYVVVAESEIGPEAIAAALSAISDLDAPEVKAARAERRRLQRCRAEATQRLKFKLHATPEQKAARLAYGAMKQREFRARQKRKAMG